MRIVADRHVRVPMRDGATLATDIYRHPHGRRPTLLQRTPYGTDLPPLARPAHGMRLVEAGYALALQDVRGRGRSDGAFAPFAQEVADGADTVSWLRAQSWCDGRIGMLGGSYLGQLQWALAAAEPDAVQAIAPHVADPHSQTWFWTGGALEWGFLAFWALSAHALPAALRRAARGEPGPSPDEVIDLLDRIEDVYRGGPARLPALVDELAPYVRTWMDPAAAHAALADAPEVESVRVPSLTIAGWHDVFCSASLRAFAAARASGAPARLVVGPWGHTVWGGAYPERDYGVRAAMDFEDVTAHHLGWFDRWLRGTRGDAAAPVRCFVQGEDAWHDLPAWPPPGVVDESWPLGLDGETSLRVDPAHPVPTLGGQTLMPGTYVARRTGPWDQRESAAHPGVAVFTSEALARPVRIAGDVRAELAVSASRPDIDVTVKLVDVHPDGRAEHVIDGVRRLGADAGPGGAAPLAHGEVRRVEVDVGATAIRFGAGHRIRVEVAGTNFPRFDLNPPNATARLTLHLAPSRGTRLVVPRWSE